MIDLNKNTDNISNTIFPKFDIKDESLKDILVRIKGTELESFRPHYQLADVFVDITKNSQYKISDKDKPAVGLDSNFKVRVNKLTFKSNIDLINNATLPFDVNTMQEFTLINMLRLARTQSVWIREKLEQDNVWFYVNRKGPSDIYNIYDYYEDLINTTINMFRKDLLTSDNIKLVAL